jgi:hypothetical protein
MSKTIDPTIHELAIRLAAQHNGELKKQTIRWAYANYLIAVQTMTELESNEEFKKDPMKQIYD